MGTSGWRAPEIIKNKELYLQNKNLRQLEKRVVFFYLIKRSNNENKNRNLKAMNRLGEYIYMGMGLVDKHRVCISVGYNLDYAIKKAEQFVEKAPNVEFTHVNKIKVGETIRTEKIMVKDLTTI